MPVDQNNDGGKIGEFQARAMALFQAGYRVVPIQSGHKGVLLEGWTKLADSQNEASLLDLIRRANGCGVGILAKWAPGVDIDVRDYQLANRLAALAEDIIGSTPQRIGEAPKILLPYRTRTPFTKLASRDYRLPGDQTGDRPHKVEVLADGQQWVAYHIHPGTGRPYHWPDGELPDWDELREITPAKAAQFIKAAEEMIVAAGGRVIASRLSGAGGNGKASSHGLTGTYEAITSALGFIHNADLAYDDWISIGIAIKGALGDEGQELWEGWSETSHKNQPEVTGKAWTSFKPSSKGAGSIYRLAQDAGWKPAPEIDLNPEKRTKRAQRKPQLKIVAATGGGDAPAPYILTEKGVIRDLVANAVTFLERREELNGHLRFNTFSSLIELSDLPWDPCDWRPLEDHDHLCLGTHAQRSEVVVKQTNCFDAMRVVAVRNPHHPVTTYLDSLKWDGTPRLDDWLFTYMGVVQDNHDGEASDRDSYIRAIGAKCLISAVARVYEPGCQADHMLVLEGPQGVGKSSAAAILGGEWFADQIADLHNKDSSQDLRGKWIFEMPELFAFRGKELERVKAYVSRRSDHYRASYGRATGDYPRQNVFIGTTNESEYLHDHTGNRRFWPAFCKHEINLADLRKNRDQLWAEACQRYRANEPWHIKDPGVQATAVLEQKDRVLSDSWEDIIATHVSGRSESSVRDIWVNALFGKIGDLTRANEMRISAACKHLGFERARGGRDLDGNRPWIYRKRPK